MRLSFLSVLVVVSSILVGCGGPAAGEPCKVTGFVCESAASALECRNEKWASLPCKGPNGCKREGDVLKCDMTGNAENDACASSAENKGLCTADGQGTLECRDGVLKKTNTCRSCSVAGDVVTCQPI